MKIIIFLLILAFINSEIWIEYFNGETYPYRYFHNVEADFFVDIGGYDTAMFSNTINLYNWQGLIVDGGSERAANINYQLPHQTVLNFIMSNVSGQTVKMLNHQQPGRSTIMTNAYKDKYIASIQNITTINMADLCHKYYLKRPKFMNLDIEGVGYLPLSTNDWENKKCIPLVIYSQANGINDISGLPDTKQFLVKKGYTPIQNNETKKNIVFIHQDSYDSIQKKFKKGQQYVRSAKRIIWENISKNFRFHIVDYGKLDFGQVKYHLKPKDPLFFYFRQPQAIVIPDINRYSNIASTFPEKNKPIVIFHYDEKKSKIFLGCKSYEIVFKDNGPDYKYAQITAVYQNYIQKVFIFDHQRYSEFKPFIIDDSLNGFSKKEQIVNKVVNISEIQQSNQLKQKQIRQLIKDSFEKIQEKKTDNTQLIKQVSNIEEIVLKNQKQLEEKLADLIKQNQSQMKSKNLTIFVLFSIIIMMMMIIFVIFKRMTKRNYTAVESQRI